MSTRERCRDLTCMKASALIREYLEGIGFSIECNGHFEGSSGASWDIDCIYKINYGILDFSGGYVLLEKIDSHIIEYYLSAKNDIGLDKILIISKYNTPIDLRNIALRLGIIIYDVDEIFRIKKVEKHIESKVYYVNPYVSIENVRVKIVEGKIKGLKSIIPLMARKRQLIGVKLALYPLVCYHARVHASSPVEELIKTKEMHLCFEAGTGSLVSLSDEGLIIIQKWSRLGEIEDDAVQILIHIAEMGTVSLLQLKEHFKNINVELALDLLEEYGLIERIGADIYTIMKPPIEEYASPYQLLSKIGKISLKEPDICHTVISTKTSIGKITNIVNSIGTVEDHFILYYPLYIAVIGEKNNGVESIILIDAITGNRLTSIEEIVRDSIVMKEIDRIVEEIESGECTSEPARQPHHP